MSLLHIVKYPHAALTTPAAPVVAFDAALATFIDDLAETMYAAEGVGLAANQVAELKRVCVIDCAGQDEPAALLELVNPQVVHGDGKIVWEEGCLSFPELYERVTRPGHVRVAYQDRTGAAHEIEADGLLAVALQHEIDHLDGVLFIDRIGPLARRRALDRFTKIMARRRADGIDD
ncbi:MAG: peptide deformylase [Myxococcales bacterium]|nr:peptide deformylase [Myxococcales bacterium]MCB9519620.1 peptide deformylase [Myxococcales bacterium]MCB9530656.1 peptide deformylase [Myxococcales bacterium]